MAGQSADHAERRIAGGWFQRRANALTAWSAGEVATLAVWKLTGGSLQQWDAVHFQTIAAHGYFSAADQPNNVAFFPGFSIALALVHLVVRDWVVAELLLAGLASLATMLGLQRLSDRAPLMQAAMPAAVFMFVGYQESLFLALGVWAWVHARNRNMPVAALLLASSSLVRPEGVFLTAGVMVMALCRKSILDALVALYGVTGAMAYEVYLWVMTGNRDAWSDAEQKGWDMHRVSPLSGFKTSWNAAFNPHWLGHQYETLFRIQIAAVLILAVACIAMLVLRMWPEFTYAALVLVTCVSMTWWESTSRELLCVFPVALVLARMPKRVQVAFAIVCVPVAAFVAFSFASGQWAG